VTPDQAIALLSVKDWPPPLEHWPPRDKSQWHPGMALVGRIEAVMTLPRPDGSKKRGEPYTALYVRREADQRIVMFHGWHTAASDLDGMHLGLGLLFACVYRGERDNGFEDFKYIVAPFDEPDPAAQQARQAGGRPTEAPPRQAPEGEAGATASPSGSNEQPTRPTKRPAPGDAAKEAGGVTDNGRPTEHAIAWLGRLPHDSAGLREVRELLSATTTEYRGLAKVAAERHYASEDGWRRMWNDTDLDNWVTVLQSANWQAAKFLDGKERRWSA
jgi:hypothetical protein